MHAHSEGHILLHHNWQLKVFRLLSELWPEHSDRQTDRPDCSTSLCYAAHAHGHGNKHIATFFIKGGPFLKLVSHLISPKLHHASTN